MFSLFNLSNIFIPFFPSYSLRAVSHFHLLIWLSKCWFCTFTMSQLFLLGGWCYNSGSKLYRELASEISFRSLAWKVFGVNISRNWRNHFLTALLKSISCCFFFFLILPSFWIKEKELPYSSAWLYKLFN